MRLTLDEARALGLDAPKKRSKYNAEPIVWNGYRFDSKREAELLIPIMKAVSASHWTFHPRYRILTGAGTYETIELDLAWNKRLIDVKGRDTKESQRKRAAFEKQYGVTVEIWK